MQQDQVQKCNNPGKKYAIELVHKWCKHEFYAQNPNGVLNTYAGLGTGFIAN